MANTSTIDGNAVKIPVFSSDLSAFPGASLSNLPAASSTPPSAPQGVHENYVRHGLPDVLNGANCVHGVALNRWCEDCAHDNWAAQFDAEDVAEAVARRERNAEHAALLEAQRLAHAAKLEAALKAIRARWAVEPVSLPVERGSVNVSSLAALFAGCVYVEDIGRIMTPDAKLLDKQRFDVRFGGRDYPLTAAPSSNADISDSAWEAFTQSRVYDFPKVSRTYFDPRDVAGEIVVRDGERSINTWRPLDIVSAPGDVAPFLNHLKLILPNGDDSLILLSYFAACAQHLGHKAAWAPFLQGVEGNGKSFLVKVMEYCLGANYVHNAAADDLGNNFNGAFYGKLLVAVDEIQINEGREALWNKLKSMITDARQEITFKGVDKVTRELCCNFLFNSNHRDGLRKTPNDRRICPLYTAQQSVADLIRDGMLDANGTTSAYFDALWDWLNKAGGAAHVLDYLRTFQIPERYDFTRGARRAPITTTTAEAMQAGLGSVEQEILAAVAEGRTGFKGGWVSSRALDVLLNETRKASTITRNKRAEILRGLGYVPHPALPRGQVHAALSNGEGRPTLYVATDHTSRGVASGAQVAAMYEAAQGAGS